MKVYKVEKAQYTLPVEVSARSFDDAARRFYRKVTKYGAITIKNDEVTKYYDRTTDSIYSEYVLVSGVMNEHRRILL